MSPRATPLSRQQRRDQVVTAVLPLVRERGRQVSTREIARAAGIAEGTVFRAFDDKEDLLRAVARHVIRPEPTVEQLRALDLDRPLDTVLADLTALLRERVEEVFAVLLAVRWLPEEAARPQPEPDPVQAAVIEVLARFADELTVTPQHAADVLRLLVFAGSHPMINEGRPLLTPEIVAVLLDGVRRRGASPGARAAPTADTAHPLVRSASPSAKSS